MLIFIRQKWKNPQILLIHIELVVSFFWILLNRNILSFYSLCSLSFFFFFPPSLSTHTLFLTILLPFCLSSSHTSQCQFIIVWQWYALNSTPLAVIHISKQIALVCLLSAPYGGWSIVLLNKEIITTDTAQSIKRK